MNPSDFPLMRAASRRPNHFDEAVQVIADGLATGVVRNVALNEAKSTLGRAAEEAWKVNVREPYFYAGKYEDLPSELQELHWSISLMSLHDVLATAKKLDKVKITHPVLDVMRAVITEALPLAQAVSSLKDKVIKGRAPAEPKPVNPNKDIKTCACCFRDIAVQRGTMAHHGYTRPGNGWQTNSCPGIRFRPLEVSSEGLEYMVKAYEASLNNLKSIYDKRDSVVQLKRRGTRGKDAEPVKKGDPSWAREFSSYVINLESEISHTARELQNLEELLKNWKPEVLPGDEDASKERRTKPKP